MEELIMALISNLFTNLVLVSTQLEKGPRFTLLIPKLSYSLEMRLNFNSSSYNKFCFVLSIYSCWHWLFLFSFLIFFLLPSLSSPFLNLSSPFLNLPPLSILPPPTATSQGPVPSQTPALKRASARQHWSPQPRTHWRDFHRSRQPWRPDCVTAAHSNKDRICPRGRGLQRWEWVDSANFGRPQRAQGRCVHTTTVFS